MVYINGKFKKGYLLVHSPPVIDLFSAHTQSSPPPPPKKKKMKYKQKNNIDRFLCVGPTKQAKLDAYCQSQFSGSSCSEGTITRAVFDRKDDQVGKQWRCYYENALTESSTGYAYDVSKSSGCLHTRDNELRSLLL